MLNVNKKTFSKLRDAYARYDIEDACSEIRHICTSKGESFSIFTTLSNLDTMVILFDDNPGSVTRYISFPGEEEKNYLILDADRSVEEMRFDACCMFARILKRSEHIKNSFCPNFTTVDTNFSREEKHFACALLMPKKDLLKFILKQDENGNYLYLNENNELPFKNIHIIADHFGVPFNQCSSRIFHVLEDLRYEDSSLDFYIEGCPTKQAYRQVKKNYSEAQREKDRKELVPNHEKNRQSLINHLIDSIHYRSWSKLSDVAKRRLLINLVKADSVNEGIVKSEDEAKEILNDYIASGGTIYDGKLITKDGEMDLTDEKLVVLGEFDLYEKTLERGLIKGIAKSNPRLGYLVNMDYKEAIEHISERDLTNYIKDLHIRLFSKLSEKYGEPRGGWFRDGEVKLAGTTVNPAPPRMIPQLMDNISWRILDILKKNVNGELTNSEYIDKVNECIYEMIRMQPFSDGNKRTSRLLSNILYQEKGIPYVLVPIKDWGNYVDAWSSDTLDAYNEMMHRLVIESYQYFYGNQSVTEVTHDKSYGKKIITENRKV